MASCKLLSNGASTAATLSSQSPKKCTGDTSPINSPMFKKVAIFNKDCKLPSMASICLNAYHFGNFNSKSVKAVFKVRNKLHSKDLRNLPSKSKARVLIGLAKVATKDKQTKCIPKRGRGNLHALRVILEVWDICSKLGRQTYREDENRKRSC